MAGRITSSGDKEQDSDISIVKAILGPSITFPVSELSNISEQTKNKWREEHGKLVTAKEQHKKKVAKHEQQIKELENELIADMDIIRKQKEMIWARKAMIWDGLATIHEIKYKPWKQQKKIINQIEAIEKLIEKLKGKKAQITERSNKLRDEVMQRLGIYEQNSSTGYSSSSTVFDSTSFFSKNPTLWEHPPLSKNFSLGIGPYGNSFEPVLEAVIIFPPFFELMKLLQCQHELKCIYIKESFNTVSEFVQTLSGTNFKAEEDLQNCIAETLAKVGILCEQESSSNNRTKSRIDIKLGDGKAICIIETKNTVHTSSEFHQIVAYYSLSRENNSDALPTVLITVVSNSFKIYGAIYFGGRTYFQLLGEINCFHSNLRKSTHQLLNLFSFLKEIEREVWDCKEPYICALHPQVPSHPPMKYDVYSIKTLLENSTKKVFTCDSIVSEAQRIPQFFVLKKSAAANYNRVAGLHRALADENMAPTLYDVKESSDFDILIMENLKIQGFKTLSCFCRKGKLRKDQIEEIKEKMNSIIKFIHERGFVHGDVRAPNIMVKVETDKVDVRLIDFDYAGKKGEATYWNISDQVDWPEGAQHGSLIKPKHDFEMLGKALSRLS